MRTPRRSVLLLVAGLLATGTAVASPAYIKIGDIEGESVKTGAAKQPAIRLKNKPVPASPARKVAPEQAPKKGNVEFEWKVEEGES